MKKYFPIQIAYWGDKIDYNLFPDPSALDDARENGTDAHSAEEAPLFINPGVGNCAVAESSPALALGFRNFPMDEFGVMTPRLRKIALQAAIPALIGQGWPAGERYKGQMEEADLIIHFNFHANVCSQIANVCMTAL